MPLYLPVTGENIGNMNWAALIVGATFLFSGVWWVFGARFRYLKEASFDTEPIPVTGEHSSSS
jgi:choline transport protein